MSIGPAKGTIKGKAPKVVITRGDEVIHEQEVEENPEREKYRKMWTHDEYRVRSPGEQAATDFLANANPKSRVIDIGAGTGRGGLMICALAQVPVLMIDFAENCLDEDIANAVENQPLMDFEVHDITQPFPEHMKAQFGFCVDVMEHLTEDQVDAALDNILDNCERVYFQIAMFDEPHGPAFIGDTLHPTVKPTSWWTSKFRERGCVVYYSHATATHCTFYVSRWAALREHMFDKQLNTDEITLLRNVQHNMKLGREMCRPWGRQNTEVMLLGGGPSLADFEDEIREKREKGMPLITTNGTYNWCVERGIKPSAQIVVDSRAWNRRFLEPTVEGCRYLLSAQCDPSLFDAVPEDQTFIWYNCVTPAVEYALDEHFGVDGYYPVPGGSTVMLRAFPLLRMLGFANFHVYGFDSALDPETEAHHAYDQKENDGEPIVTVSVGDKLFHCHAWMAKQATEFMDLIRAFGDEINLAVYGTGLIAHIIQTAAEGESTDGDGMVNLQSG